MSLIVNVGVSAALYSPLGIAGIVIGTAVASAAMTVAQAFFLRRRLHGFEIGTTLNAVVRMLAAGALLGLVSYEAWNLLDEALGRSLPGQFVSVTASLLLGSAAYAAAVLALRIPEAHQIIGLIRGRMSRGAS
jgi:putative peptidoglycan lipid II flippase